MSEDSEIVSSGRTLHDSRSGSGSRDCRNARDKRVVWVEIPTKESPPMTTTARLVSYGLDVVKKAMCEIVCAHCDLLFQAAKDNASNRAIELYVWAMALELGCQAVAVAFAKQALRATEQDIQDKLAICACRCESKGTASTA